MIDWGTSCTALICASFEIPSWFAFLLTFLFGIALGFIIKSILSDSKEGDN